MYLAQKMKKKELFVIITVIYWPIFLCYAPTACSVVAHFLYGM